MSRVPENSADMILCDLPYGTINWKTPHTWDNIIPFEEMWRQYWRIVKPNCPIVLFGNEPFSTLLKHSQLRRYKYDYVWIKSKAGGFANAKVKPLKQYETISIFSEGTTSPGRENNMPYFAQGLTEVNRIAKNSGKSRIGMTVRSNAKKEYLQQFEGYPNDILIFPLDKGWHPTQKPVGLFEHLIRTYTSEGGTVLDNCAGSGTTAIACQNTNRRWVCIEQSEEYFTKAVDRIKMHETQNPAENDVFDFI